MRHYKIILTASFMALSCSPAIAMEVSPIIRNFQNTDEFRNLERRATGTNINKPGNWQKILVDFGKYIASDENAYMQYSRKAKVWDLFAGKDALEQKIKDVLTKYKWANTLAVYADSAYMLLGKPPANVDEAITQAGRAAEAVAAAAGTASGSQKTAIKTKITDKLAAIGG